MMTKEQQLAWCSAASKEELLREYQSNLQWLQVATQEGCMVAEFASICSTLVEEILRRVSRQEGE